ncbi:hypothetical protein EDB84DRAFT_1557366 [Lactarius hengduanensis]|nr:hypothetical protein EDB84DRAFT_1557366 [Lactarius hengduanensis]
MGDPTAWSIMQLQEVTGARSEDDSLLAPRKYPRIVQKLGFDTKFSGFKIQNITDVKFPLQDV